MAEERQTSEVGMNRRGFLGKLIGGVAAAAAVRTWPFRVYSFPAEVVPAFNPIDTSFYQLYTTYFIQNLPTMKGLIVSEYPGRLSAGRFKDSGFVPATQVFVP